MVRDGGSIRVEIALNILFGIGQRRRGQRGRFGRYDVVAQTTSAQQSFAAAGRREHRIDGPVGRDGRMFATLILLLFLEVGRQVSVFYVFQRLTHQLIFLDDLLGFTELVQHLIKVLFGLALFEFLKIGERLPIVDCVDRFVWPSILATLKLLEIGERLTIVGTE